MAALASPRSQEEALRMLKESSRYEIKDALIQLFSSFSVHIHNKEEFCKNLINAWKVSTETAKALADEL